jgi:hypothetical protein
MGFVGATPVLIFPISRAARTEVGVHPPPVLSFPLWGEEETRISRPLLRGRVVRECARADAARQNDNCICDCFNDNRRTLHADVAEASLSRLVGRLSHMPRTTGLHPKRPTFSPSPGTQFRPLRVGKTLCPSCNSSYRRHRSLRGFVWVA